MKAYQIQKHGIEGLVLVDLPEQEPAPGQLLLRMQAASLNFRDAVILAGHAPARLPVVPLSDGAGIVAAIGDGVTDYAVGDLVTPIFAPGWRTGPPTRTSNASALGGWSDGVLRESMLVDARDVVPAPAHLSAAEAACLPCAALTAWSAIYGFGETKPGDLVLIEGTGGVALFALMFAKLCAATVVVISSSDEKLERAAALGADHTINYRDHPDWGTRVKDLSDGRGADLVIELGGATTLGQALEAVKYGGRVAQIGVLTGAVSQTPLFNIITKHVTLRGGLVGSREAFIEMNRAIALAGLRPVIDRIVPFAEAPGALSGFAQGGHFGKVVIDLAS